MKIKFWLSFVCVFLSGYVGTFPLAAAEKVPEIALLVDGEVLDPATTLEFRFSKPMVTRDELGIATAATPIVFQPVLAGKFTWLSTRSGVFVPDQAPPLGISYELAPKKDLQAQDGSSVGAGFTAKLKTPPFAIFRSASGTGGGESIYPNPDVRYALNLPVDLKSAANRFQFVAANGEKISGEVRYATGQDYFNLGASEGDWQKRWELARNPAGTTPKTSVTESDWDAERQKDLPNRLVITPATPLSSGTRWHLEMTPGLASADGKYRLNEPLNLPLGIVEPFTVVSLEASSLVNAGRNLDISFSNDLAPDITVENAEKFLKITPEVKNLRIEPSYSSLTISGDFQRDLDYQISFDPKLVSNSGLPLDGAQTRAFRFEPVKPRIYLPEITATQLRHGLRKFLVRSVNLEKLEVTARLVKSVEVPKAMEAFNLYNKQEYDEKNPDESYQPLSPDAISGQILKTLTFTFDPATNPLDAPQNTELDWDAIVGADTSGAVYLTVEGTPRAEVGGKRPGAQSLVQLTNIGVLWKKTAAGLQVNVFSLATGKAISGASLALLDLERTPQKRAMSDGNGEAILPVAADPGWLVVDLADDTLALRMGGLADDLPTASFNLPIYYSDWDAPAKTDEPRALLFTDRPLYLPGEIVKIKGFVRTTGDQGISPAAQLDGKLILSNPKGEKLLDLPISTDTRGNFDGEIALPIQGVGRYGIRFEATTEGGGSAYAGFEVADFQPNAFELKADLPNRLGADEKLTAQISARYFFGATLANTPVRWTLRQALATDVPEGFARFELPISEDGPLKNLSLRGETTLDDQGKATIAPQIPEPKGAPTKNILTVETTDLNQQTVSESRTIVQDSSEYYLGIAKPEAAVFQINEALPVQVIAISPEGKPLPKPVKVSAEVIFQRHTSVRVQGAGNAISFRNEETEEIVSSATGDSLLPEKEADQWNVRTGQTALLKTGGPGDYLLRVKSTDTKGHEAVTEWNFYVAGKGETVWDYRNPARVDLVPDKVAYQVGDVAKILVKAPISGEALVSIQQRDRILRTQRIRLEGNAPTIEVPIDALDAPNIYVDLILLRGTEESTRTFKMPEYRHGICRLNVTDPAKALRVEITPSTHETEPGAELTSEIVVRDGRGQPMADAEVAFFAVDDGILALTGYERPNPSETFAAPWPLNVRTGLSLADLVPENPDDLVFGNKGYLIGGGGLEGPGQKLRRDFPGTLAWFPSLKTDGNGKISVKFKVPDALTRYRLVAVASALGDYFGSGESAFSIRKTLSLLPSLGQFANVGDQIAARCVVRNDTGVDGSAEVTLLLDATANSDKPLTASVPLKNGTAAAVDFPVQLRAMGTASWQWTTRLAAGGKVYEDGVISTMKVGSPAVLLRETYLTDLSGKTSDLLKDINPQLLEGTGSVTVSVANTRLASLRESVTQLLEYPYGCAEQTTSALVPWLAMKDLRPILPDLAAKDEKKAVQTSVEKLFAMQTPSGGLSYWPGGNVPSFFASAYAATALATLEKQGTALPPGWDKLTSWLSSQLRDVQKLRYETDLADASLALYALALAGKSEPAYHENLYQRRSEISLESRALLALAMAESGGSPKVIADLLDSRKPAPESSSWFGGAARERAIQLLAWSRFQPKSGEIPRLVKELLASRKNGEWSTTQQNAWALLALAKYYRTVEKGGQDAAGTLLAEPQKIPFAVTKTKPAATHSFDFTPEMPPTSLVVENPQKKALFGEARFVVRPPVANQPSQNRGYAVSRSYQKLAGDGGLIAADDLKVGDRVLVTLRLETSRPGHFVAIDDPLPAVFEGINPAFQAGNAPDEDGVSDYREMRKDRVLIFCDHLPAGAFTFHYLARVRTAGTVTAPATKVEEMYRPERFGLGSALQVVSRAAQ